MSSYLNFYLVPKKTRKSYGYSEEGNTEKEIKLTEGLPLSFLSYSRNNGIYQAYNETLNPAYAGMEEKYTELTYEKAKKVVEDFKEGLKKTESRLETDYKMLREGGYSSELWEEIHSFEDYLKEEKETLEELKYVANLVCECTQYSDFEKVLINIT